MSTRQFGATWWGQAWIAALEERAAVDPTRLPRGRTYARQDRVGRLELAPGKVTALVRGQRALPYRVTVTVPTARAGALEGPSVTSRERIFRFGVPSVLGESAIRTQYDRRADGGYP